MAWQQNNWGWALFALAMIGVHLQGAAFGAQTAASSLGAAFGVAAGWLLFDATFLANAAFLIIGGLVLIGLVISLKLPNVLTLPSINPKGDQNVLSK